MAPKSSTKRLAEALQIEKEPGSHSSAEQRKKMRLQLAKKTGELSSVATPPGRDSKAAKSPENSTDKTHSRKRKADTSATDNATGPTKQKKKPAAVNENATEDAVEQVTQEPAVDVEDVPSDYVPFATQPAEDGDSEETLPGYKAESSGSQDAQPPPEYSPLRAEDSQQPPSLSPWLREADEELKGMEEAGKDGTFPATQLDSAAECGAPSDIKDAEAKDAAEAKAEGTASSEIQNAAAAGTAPADADEQQQAQSKQLCDDPLLARALGMKASSIAKPPDSKPKIIDSVVALQLEAQKPQHPNCVKCGQVVDPLRAQLKSKTSPDAACRWICRECNCITTVFCKHMKWPPQEFSVMDVADQERFFADCHKAVAADGRFKYTKLRASLHSSLTNRKITEQKAQVDAPFLPLEMYAAKGLSEVQLKNIENEAEMELHPVLGKTYKVGIKTVSTSVIIQQVEEAICRAEAQLKAKTSTDLKDRDALDDVFDADENKLLALTNGSASPSDEGNLSEAEKKKLEQQREKEKKQKEKEDAKQKLADAKKEKQEISKHNTSVCNLATKTLAKLGDTALTIASLKKNAGYSLLPDVMVANFEEKSTDVQDKLKKSKDALAKQASAATKKSKIDALDFELVDVAKLAKDVNDLFSDLNKMIQLMKPK